MSPPQRGRAERGFARIRRDRTDTLCRFADRVTVSMVGSDSNPDDDRRAATLALTTISVLRASPLRLPEMIGERVER